jgi:hypothetical protein
MKNMNTNQTLLITSTYHCFCYPYKIDKEIFNKLKFNHMKKIIVFIVAFLSITMIKFIKAIAFDNRRSIKISSCLIVLLFIISYHAISQNNSQIKSILDHNLIFSGVKNGFIYDFKLPEKLYLTPFEGISANVTNTGDDMFRIEAMINDDPMENSCIYIDPGENKTIQVIIQRLTGNGATIFPEMSGLPGGTIPFIYNSTNNDTVIKKITFKVFAKGNTSFIISEIKPFGQFISAKKISDTPGFFPFIDVFGQYKHADWPGKTKSDSDLKRAIDVEANNLRSVPGPSGRDRFGGWANGPKLKATGYFRTEKVAGKWWLVDPEGCLYWSHGITCVDFNGAQTLVSGRNNFFENLPDKTGPMEKFYSSDRKGDTTFDFTKANLFRKYGKKWKEKAIENALKRLKSWGFNSFGNWSDPEIYLYGENRVPYTVGISSARFLNVFDPAFRESLKTSLNRLDPKIKDDPYCIGFFIDNELHVDQITARLISQPGNNKSRFQFFEYLKSKYTSVDKLNENWKTSYSDWQQVDAITKLPEGAKKEDIQFFNLKILDLYYKICRNELKSYAPNKIYFGSRLPYSYLSDDPSVIQIIKIAAKYCDVVCFNRYRFSTNDLILPFGIDKPTLIGEFHWGALDRGLFSVGMRGVADQNQRADDYYHFIEGALNNPQIVGTHWFQYSDEPTAGRFDGENYQIGFVDVCDNPYPEIVNAARKIGYKMYRIRYKKSQLTDKKIRKK